MPALPGKSAHETKPFTLNRYICASWRKARRDRRRKNVGKIQRFADSTELATVAEVLRGVAKLRSMAKSLRVERMETCTIRCCWRIAR